jgi:XTP/dITP diphosphohydrolase
MQAHLRADVRLAGKRLLLKELSRSVNRNARFRTVITLIGLNGVQVFEGVVRGSIRHEKAGSAGFGYDPVFQPDGFNKTMAEMSMAEKNTISHRGNAVRKLIDYLKAFSK